MAVKVLTRKMVPRNKAIEIIPLFRELRGLAMRQKGFLACETLRNLENPEEFIVISTWRTSKDLKNWMQMNEIKKAQEKIDLLLGEKTGFQMFYYGFTE